MISILSIAFNQRKYTEMLLASLARPECADLAFKLIFIDNGSTDSTRELVHKYRLDVNPNFKGLIYFAFPENRGVAAAVNRGFKLAETEYVLQADNDVVFGPRSLSCLIEWMHLHPGSLVSPNWPWIQKKLGTTFFRSPADLTPAKMKKLEKTGFKARLETHRATGSCWLSSRELFERVGGWDEGFRNICASDDFAWKVAVSGAERYTIPSPVYHPGKITRGQMPRSSEQQEKDVMRFVEKWGGHPEDKSRLRALQIEAGLEPDPRPRKFWNVWRREP